MGGSTSLMPFPEHGIVVAVRSNLCYADTPSIALKIAQAFVEQGISPARKSCRPVNAWLYPTRAEAAPPPASPSACGD